jgi:hypothetical protein
MYIQPNSNENDEFGSNPPDGYRIRVASNNATFTIEDSDVGNLFETESFDLEFTEEFEFINNARFSINGLNSEEFGEPADFPTVLIELSAPFDDNRLSQAMRPHAVLVFDPRRGMLVDWATAAPESLQHNFSPIEEDRHAIYFELPLLPSDPETEAEPGTGFLRAVNNWNQSAAMEFVIVGFTPDLEDFSVLILERFINLELPINNFAFGGWRALSQLSNDTFSRNLAEKIDRKIVPQEQLLSVDQNGKLENAKKSDLAAMAGDVVLFCHGFISSIDKCFVGLLKDADFRKELNDKYRGNLLAWDHWTLSKSTLQNAQDLLIQFDGLKDVTIDIVCHSRGALVMRNLMENPAIAIQLQRKGIKIRTSVFVAGACIGTQLAEMRNINRLLKRMNMTLWLLGIASIGTAAVILLIKALAMGAKTFPGVISLDPKSLDIQRLNSYGNTEAKVYAYIRANYDHPNRLIRWLEQIYWDSAIFQNEGNDLIVPFTGAGIEPTYLSGKVTKIENWNYGTNYSAQGQVQHINFFEQNRVKSEIKANLGI